MASPTRTYDARPDSMDFRDEMFIPTLVDVPAERSLANFLKSAQGNKRSSRKWPILDQGSEGACTGFALATVCHYLLRTVSASTWKGEVVSARMLYTTAKRYDEWPGTDYEGSSARGAMKGWHKHGVCVSRLWPNNPTSTKHKDHLTGKRAENAAQRPLGAYFRVNHKDLVAIHAAINEVGILFATSLVHGGWDNVTKNGMIRQENKILGGHAFVIVGYDVNGFWLQNSWGTGWGKGGFAHVSYSDWLANGMDVWVARLGVPVRLDSGNGSLSTGRRSGVATSRFSFSDLRGHIVSVGNDGELLQTGQFGTNADDVDEIFSLRMPEVIRNWKKPKILIYTHGGLVSEGAAIKTIEDNLPQLLEHEIYPIFFIWNTDFFTTLRNILRDALSRRKSEGLLDSTMDFMLDRLDDALEPLARTLGGKSLWSEMKENALKATTGQNGAARLVAEYMAEHAGLADSVHLIGHSAGSIFLAPFAQLLGSARSGVVAGPMKDYVGFDVKISTCHLWAPACTIDLFNKTYLPLAQSNAIDELVLYTLTDKAERDDDCENIYHKSLLYLVSNAFESEPRIPLIRPDGAAILGMQKFIERDKPLSAAINTGQIKHVLSPNQVPTDQCDAARATRHGDFDNDNAVRISALGDILGKCLVTPAEEEITEPQNRLEKRAAMNRELMSTD